MKTTNRSGFTIMELLVIVLFIILIIWTDRNLDFWLTYWKGEAVNCPWWLSFLAACLLPLALAGNLVGEIARLIVQ